MLMDTSHCSSTPLSGEKKPSPRKHSRSGFTSPSIARIAVIGPSLLGFVVRPRRPNSASRALMQSADSLRRVDRKGQINILFRLCQEKNPLIERNDKCFEKYS